MVSVAAYTLVAGATQCSARRSRLGRERANQFALPSAHRLSSASQASFQQLHPPGRRRRLTSLGLAFVLWITQYKWVSPSPRECRAGGRAGWPEVHTWPNGLKPPVPIWPPLSASWSDAGAMVAVGAAFAPGFCLLLFATPKKPRPPARNGSLSSEPSLSPPARSRLNVPPAFNVETAPAVAA